MIALLSMPGPNEMLILLILVVLLLLGPSKIPQLARALGEAVREFKKAQEGIFEETTSSSSIEQKQKASEDKLIYELAKKLGVSTEGKSPEQLKEEVLEKAKKEGLI